MSSELLCSPHCYEPRVNLAIVQNWRDRQKQTWYLDTWVTSLAACFSTLSHALYQMVAQPYHHLTPISLRSTPKPLLQLQVHGLRACRNLFISHRGNYFSFAMEATLPESTVATLVE